jgi:hypothetical protein
MDQVTATVFVSPGGEPCHAFDSASSEVGRRVAGIYIGDLALHFRGTDDEELLYSLDRVIGPLTKLRAAASARAIDALVADLEAHPLVP